ncbi:uncharacterized protein LOC141617379 [Silene latifolia]|uniref:uncharacterized protein LOC141617379 n=1 Tax=Silene latifolia TaxID=37657 RepID=UPI003D7862E3
MVHVWDSQGVRQDVECEDNFAPSDTELDDGFDSDNSSSFEDDSCSYKVDMDDALMDVNTYYVLDSGDENEIPKYLTNGSSKYIGKAMLAASEAKSCPWRVYASLLPDGITFQIKTLNNQHTCTRLDKNPTVKYPWIAEVLKDDFKENTSMNVTEMKDLLVHKLPTYIQLILERAPHSICGITWNTTEVPRSIHVFTKLYISFEGLYQGFLKGCRPFIGVDGSHLRGKYGGTLLVAATLDGNNGILPIAYAVVDKETKETWSFFFYHLKRMANTETRSKWVIMSDRQKGVEAALDEQLPEVSRRICARHFYANFKQEWPGDLMKKHFWTASKAHSEFVFTKAMNQIKKYSTDAYGYLMDVPLELEIRALPILSMLEGIRRRSMKKLQKKMRAARKWNTEICPRVDKMVQLNWDDGYRIQDGGERDYTM